MWTAYALPLVLRVCCVAQLIYFGPPYLMHIDAVTKLKLYTLFWPLYHDGGTLNGCAV